MRNIFIIKTKVENRGFIPNFFHVEQFPPENYEEDIDYRTQTFLERMRGENISSICLPISLTNNFFEFSGLTFAHHLRLSRDLDFCDVPIIFYGSLKLEQILRVTTLARILLTANVHYVNIENYPLEQIAKSLEQIKIKDSSFSDFLNYIQLSPPENYDSHHSIDNELSLIQWSKYIGCYKSLPTDFKKEFDSRLYFKYLNATNPIEKPKESNPFVVIGEAKVLLIDDQAESGWSIFYKTFFKSAVIKFSSLNINYKRLTQDEIINSALAKIEDFDADLVLLDLRLCDTDFNEDVKPVNLTGMQILNQIKQKSNKDTQEEVNKDTQRKLNKGTQVIITTASNKALSYKSSLTEGADGYILKNGNGDIEDTFREIKRLMIKSISRAKFLKEVDRNISIIKELISNNQYIETPDNIAKNKFFTNLDIAYELLDISYNIEKKEKYYSYSYLQLFICIEEFLNLEKVFKFGDKCYVNQNILVAEKKTIQEQKDISSNQRTTVWSSSIKYEKKHPRHYTLENDDQNTSLNPLQTDYKMSAVLIYLFNQETSNTQSWPIIRNTRNQKAAHPEKGVISSEEIINLLEYLKYIFNEENTTNDNTKASLTENI